MHWLDRLATMVIRRPRLYPRLFPDGWGDRDHLDALMARVRAHDWVFDPIVPRSTGRFESGHPIWEFETNTDVLPADLGPGQLLWIGRLASRQTVFLAASNDHSYRTRLSVAERLIERGIGSLLHMHPYYGTRRRHPGPQPIRTVAEFVEMGLGAASEGVGLTSWLAGQGIVTGVAGFSMGGSNAAVVGALSEVPIAVAAIAASHSSSPVFTEGILADSVDWQALGGEAEARPRLRDLLLELDILELAAPAHTSAAVFGLARGDGYVPEAFVRPTLDHWPGAEAVYVDPGHAGFHLWGKQAQADIVERSFDRFERQGFATRGA